MHEILDNNLDYNGKIYYQFQFRGNLFNRYIPINDWLYLIGIYLSEGNLYKIKDKQYKSTHRGTSYRITISQYKDVNLETYNKIEQVLNNLGIRYSKK